MTNFLNWIIEPAISISLFYLAYVLFLRKEAFFRANRYYLLTAVMFSVVLPLLNFSPPVALVDYSFLIEEVVVSGETGQGLTRANAAWPAGRIIMTLYLVAASLLAVRLLLRLRQLYMLVSRNRATKQDGCYIVEIETETSPFSFLNYIFINSGQYREHEKQKIIEHELVHINQFHTFDLIMLEVVTILQWYNPVVWHLKRSMIEVHEYLADYEIIKKGTSVTFYQSLLLNLQTGTGYFSPAHNFNKSLTLNRIRMMTKMKPAAWRIIKFFVLLPALILLVFMCTKSENDIIIETGQDPAKTFSEFEKPVEAIRGADGILRAREMDVSGKEIFFIVEEMPGFQGKGQNGFRDYIAQNVTYPEFAKERGIQGRVFVQFVVNADGTVNDAVIVRGVDPSLDLEALRVVKSSPKWEPGRQRGIAVNVAFTFPINFSLE
jgi:TonB family protein